MLLSLLVVVLAASGCVLWFMREAMHNERLAVREKLAEAYAGQLSLMQARVMARWDASRSRLDSTEPAEARFERCVREKLADSVISMDAEGGIGYPRAVRARAEETTNGTQGERRGLVQEGKTDEAVQFVLKRFTGDDSAVDEEGRVVAANAELLALELLEGKSDARAAKGSSRIPPEGGTTVREARIPPEGGTTVREKILTRLQARLTQYGANTFPAAQRRFLMHELQRRDPTIHFPTLAAEDLAARYLESGPVIPSEAGVHGTELRDVWIAPSPQGSVLALYTTAGLRGQLDAVVRKATLPAGVSMSVRAPGEESSEHAPSLLDSPLAGELPGWRLALFLDDRSLFDTEAARRVRFHVITAGVVIAGMSVLSLFMARGFGRQVKLARLKNDLVATVSHELKTPLTAMRALVDTLLDAERPDERTTREYLQLLSAENSRLSRLIENFLAFSRLERNKTAFVFETVTAQEMVDNAIAAFGERGRAPGCVLEARVAPGLPSFQGDRGALTTALLNLLNNAWKYSGDDKKIVLSADAFERGIRFTVTDNGIGLSATDMRRVFDPFFQADQRLARTVGGCGLGLGIVRAIVEGHHGEVRVASDPDGGSVFTIDIPAGREALP
jgi:signal transduction histidine kinase